MSRPPPPPPPLTYRYSSPSSPIMADTQSAPSYPPSQYLDYPSRRLPQPIQLPPLSIPQGSPRPEYHQPSPQSQSLPAIHSSVPVPPRSQPRSYSGSASLDKLLSPHPYTPPRSEHTYSPQHSPPRSAADLRAAPRSINEKYSHEETRPPPPEPAYLSPVEPQRHSYSSLPSPASSYAPTYPQPPQPPSNQYRPQIAHPAHPPHPAHITHQPHPPPPYGSPVYSEPAPAQAPQQPRPLPAVGPPPGAMQEKSNLQYELRVRQQPIAARACGFGERDRRVIDPPPIIQLCVTDPQTGTVDLDELRYSLNVVHCTLWSADGTHEETALIQPDRRTTRRLMGQLVASPSVAKDEHDVEGCFFCFPDLSCRTHGKYRLRFILMRIDPTNLHVGGFSPILTEVLSDVFTVYTAKDFPGMRPSSALTRALKLQGCNIQVKKGNEKALARKRVSPSSEDDENAGDADAKGAKKRRKD